ncbi:MAG TPA: hypothetical protein VFX61_19910 [Micromonosporaceae bacterium]|nr:hypothetical protein [Micromonosporaceae bacterium]
MAVRGSGRSIATAVGVAAGTGAAQLGLGYGLGIIAWLPPGDGPEVVTWLASLTWTVWIAATSTVAGAVCSQRLTAAPAAEARAGIPRRVTLAAAAAAGALITVALVAVPARATAPPESGPQLIAAGYAAAGISCGLVVAFWALSSRAVAINVLVTTTWLWLLALFAVIDRVATKGIAGSVDLGVWPLNVDRDHLWFRDHFYWPTAIMSLGSALVIGVLAARRPARRPEARVGAAASGAVGPLLVAAAYLLVAPQAADLPTSQLSAHLMAPYAALAGLAGSVLVAVLAQRAEGREQLKTTADTADPPGEVVSEPDAASDPPLVPAQQTGPAEPSPESANAAASTTSEPRGPEESGNQKAPKRKPRRLGRESP